MVDQGRVGESTWAAEAAECANRQGKFWEYHDMLFNQWRGENVGTFTKPNLEKYASDLKLDTAAFNQCLESDATKSVVDGTTNDAARLGVNATPSFFLSKANGQLQSLQPRTLDFSQFSGPIDSLLR